MKLLLFLTSDLSLSSVPSKYSVSLSFLLYYFKSSVSFSAFPVGGVGVNFNPLSNKDISKSLSCLADRSIIFMSFICFLSIESFVLGFGFGLGSGLCRGLCPFPGPNLKKTADYFHQFSLRHCLQLFRLF